MKPFNEESHTFDTLRFQQSYKIITNHTVDCMMKTPKIFS